MTRTLVAYWSKTGHTRTVAEEIARVTGGDLEELVGTGSLGTFGIALGTLLGRPAPIAPLRQDPAAYDLVLIGTPVWFARPLSPVHGFVARHRSALGRVAFFCTEGGRGHDTAFDQLARACGREPAATLAVTEAELKSGAHRDKVSAFARRLATQ